MHGVCTYRKRIQASFIQINHQQLFFFVTFYRAKDGGLVKKVLLLCACLLSSVLAEVEKFPPSDWLLGLYNGADATYSNGLVTILAPGDDFWNIQLVRKDIPLLQGHSYTANFTLQALSVNRHVEVRLGRNAFPYDAFGEFGERLATVAGKAYSETFLMQANDVANARFEFNLGKYPGSVFISNVSLVCNDCNGANSSGTATEITGNTEELLSADTVSLADNTDTLGGDVSGKVLELGVDSKIHGNVSAANCFLRERVNVFGILTSTASCTEQNGVFVKERRSSPIVRNLITVKVGFPGSEIVSVPLNGSRTIAPGKYTAFYANSKACVTFSSGEYAFSNFYTKPEDSLTFDLSRGPVKISVGDGLRIGDRNTFRVLNGNPSEVTFIVGAGAVDFGTDGLFLGKILAPKSDVRVASRTRLVGGIYAQSFRMEPQSSLSREPQAEEISYSEEHFAPFYSPSIYRYIAEVPKKLTSIEMFIYADSSLSISVNGDPDRTVALTGQNNEVNISLGRSPISGFPQESFSAKYKFTFVKNPNYRIYWNSQGACKSNCDGSSTNLALTDFDEALKRVQSSGKELVMSGGTLDASPYAKNGKILWPVGFKMVGYEGEWSDFNRKEDMPTIDLQGTAHIEIEGKSPRSLQGLLFKNGKADENGGTFYSHSSKLKLTNIIMSNSFAKKSGGGIYFDGDSLFAKFLYFNQSSTGLNGGALYSSAYNDLRNVFFIHNSSQQEGAALYFNKNTIIKNMIAVENRSEGEGILYGNFNVLLKLWNATIFKNSVHKGNRIVSGKVNGEVWNSILWKNSSDSCESQACLNIPSSISFNESSSEKDPKFRSESAPAGNAYFLGADVGLALDVKAPFLNKGKEAYAREQDILGVDRDAGTPIGAYALYVAADRPVEYGEIQYGEFVPVQPSRPLFPNFPTYEFIEYYGHSKYGRVMRALVKKHSKTKIDKAVVRITLLDSTGTPYPDAVPIDVPFYTKGEVNGKYAFYSLIHSQGTPGYDPEKHGRSILFSKAPKDQGYYDQFIVIYVKKSSDRFQYEVIKW